MGAQPWLLEALGDDERRRVLVACGRRRFKRGEVVFHEGDPGDALHLIEKGHVAIRIGTPLGDVATLAVLGPDEAFGEGALLAPDSRRTASAVAVEGAETRTLSGTAFADLCQRHPRVQQLLTDQLAAQVRRLSANLVEAHYVAADQRVLRRLVLLCELFDGGGTRPADAGVPADRAAPAEGRAPTDVVVVPLTQEELASMAGTTRPTANRVLRDLEVDGLIALGRGRVTVLDPGGLRARAG